VIFQAAVFRRDIIQPGLARNILNYCQLFGSAVDKMKMGLREKDSQRDARESTSGASIKDFCPGFEINDFSNAQGMKYMSFIKVVNILPGDDVDQGVPFLIKRPELLKLIDLMSAQIRKIAND